MKSVFEQSVREELISRISSLRPGLSRKWGKMNVYQMVKHCVIWDDMIHTNKIYKRNFIGRLVGRFVLNKELRNAQMRPGSPTIPEMKVREGDGNLDAEKAAWIALIRKYAEYSLPDYTYVHPFFGKMTREEIGYIAYKHADHHLRQFGC